MGGSPFAAAWRAVADAAGVAAGTSLLDLGCGDGGFCAFAAGRGATPHGIDADPDAIGQALTALPDRDFRLGLIESLPWPEDSFDVATAFNVVQYALDPDLALAEAARVVRPSGRVAVCKWGRPADNEFFAFLLALGANGVHEDELPAGDPIETAIRSGAAEIVESGHVPAPIVISDGAALQASLERAAGATVAADLDEAAEPYRQTDGTYRFDNRLRYWILRP